MTAKYERYYEQVRAPRNEVSRNSATKHKELWSEPEVETLTTLWDPSELETLAEMLGRTVEACRQKFYELQQQGETRKAAVKAVKAVDKWSKGFTSLEDMGY